MLHGDKITLRARHEADVEVLHAALYDDVDERSRTDPRPWSPISLGTAASPYAPRAEPDEHSAAFSVVAREDGELAGVASLWGIDSHNRFGHLGISLLPAFRGRGFGLDVIRVLCAFGFSVRGLRRLQLETLGDNTAMIATAGRAGFRHEGTLRRAAWVKGEFLDEEIFGLLVEEWQA